MNIVTPIPTSFAIPTANLSVEAARRDNLVRETIPQTADPKQGSAEQGLGSESDKLKSSVKGQQPLTYEKLANSEGNTSQATSESAKQFDNANDESAGKDDAQARQQQQAEQQDLESLKHRDQEVRTHEQAHASIGGQYAGSPQYEYQQGPDGVRYAVDGEVSIDVSQESTPEQTVRKMQQVRAAALAPAEPSAQDLQVAAEAARLAFEARADIAEEQREAQFSAAEPAGESTGFSTEFVNLTEPASNIAAEAAQAQRSLDIDLPKMQRRNSVISNFYARVANPEQAGFSASA